MSNDVQRQSPSSSARRGKSSSVGKRRRAREMAMQMLYQQELGGSPVQEIFAHFDLAANALDPGDEQGAGGDSPKPLGGRQRRLAEEAFDYACRLVEGALAHGSEIDALIRQHAENWRLERMPPIDRNILRLAVYEMLYEEQVPRVVIVDEAIELAKKFGAENSGRFVNGLLDGILQSQGAQKTPKVTAAVEGA